MKLTNDRVSQFKTSGYTTVPGFFAPDELAALRAEADHWVAEAILRDVSTRQGKQNLQLIPLYRRSRLYRAVVFEPKVVDAVKTLIGDPVVKILDQVFVKPPGTGMGTHWHTDNAYFGLSDPMRGVAMWIALHDATAANGTLKVVPDVFREVFAHVRDPASDHHIRTTLDEAAAVHCELEAGGVVFFCFGTPHATGDNTTHRLRAGVGVHFVNFDHAPQDMIEGSRWEQVFLTGDRATGGESEYGERIAGTFRAEMLAISSG